MAIYPTQWQIQCDSCGDVARGASGTGVQEVLMSSVQQGWVLQVQSQAIPPTVMLCVRCATQRAAAAARADDNGAPTEEPVASTAD